MMIATAHPGGDSLNGLGYTEMAAFLDVWERLVRHEPEKVAASFPGLLDHRRHVIGRRCLALPGGSPHIPPWSSARRFTLPGLPTKANSSHFLGKRPELPPLSPGKVHHQLPEIRSLAMHHR